MTKSHLPPVVSNKSNNKRERQRSNLLKIGLCCCAVKYQPHTGSPEAQIQKQFAVCVLQGYQFSQPLGSSNKVFCFKYLRLNLDLCRKTLGQIQKWGEEGYSVKTGCVQKKLDTSTHYTHYDGTEGHNSKLKRTNSSF